MNILFKPIDVERVPRVKLYNGIEIPAIGLGTFGSDNYSPAQVAEAVKRAVLLGYRHIDCASIYGNEKEIGAVLKELQQAGVVQREELWITSKVWNNRHDDVVGSCKQSLLDLELDYLDLFLVHWPFPNHHASGVSVDSRDPHAVPYIHENYMKTWEAMESLLDAGLVRCIGTSNMTIPKMELLLETAASNRWLMKWSCIRTFNKESFSIISMEMELRQSGSAPSARLDGQTGIRRRKTVFQWRTR